MDKPKSHVGCSRSVLIESALKARDAWPDLFEKRLNLATSTFPFHRGEKDFVFAAGNPATAKMLIVGEAPGSEEKKFHIPFVGPAGALLSQILFNAGIERAHDVVLTNTVSLAPVGLGGTIGKPLPADMTIERPALIEMVSLLKPKVVMLLGKYALADLAFPDMVDSFAANKQPLGDQDLYLNPHIGKHSKLGPILDVPVFVGYHPSYLLRRISYANSRNSGKEEVQAELSSYRDMFMTASMCMNDSPKQKV